MNPYLYEWKWCPLYLQFIGRSFTQVYETEMEVKKVCCRSTQWLSSLNIILHLRWFTFCSALEACTVIPFILIEIDVYILMPWSFSRKIYVFITRLCSAVKGVQFEVVGKEGLWWQQDFKDFLDMSRHYLLFRGKKSLIFSKLEVNGLLWTVFWL